MPIGTNYGMPLPEEMADDMYKKPTLQEDMKSQEQCDKMLNSMLPVTPYDDALNNVSYGKSIETVKDLNLDKMSGGRNG